MICKFCGYDKYTPDASTGVCLKCGGSLSFEGIPNYQLPRKWKRDVAFWVDLVPLAFFLWLAESIGWESFSRSDISLWTLLLYALYVLTYFTILPRFFGNTPGQVVMGIKTVDEKTLQNPSLWKLLLREILFLTVFTGFGLLYFLFRGFYWDRVSGVTPVEVRSRSEKLTLRDYMDIFKEIWFKISPGKKLLILVILATGFLFYWYEYRPSEARKKCADYADTEDRHISRSDIEWERIYNACMKSKGF